MLVAHTVLFITMPGRMSDAAACHRRESTTVAVTGVRGRSSFGDGKCVGAAARTRADGAILCLDCSEAAGDVDDVDKDSRGCFGLSCFLMV